jgi:hypothetical protein
MSDSSPTPEKLDAVLPVAAPDLGRFLLWQRSAAAHLEPLATCWVVVPDKDLPKVKAAVTDRRCVVLPDSEVVPEFLQLPGVRGWYKQQLIKLAMADLVGTPNYLVFDADVVCARPVRLGDLVTDGKAVCLRHHGNIHPNWYHWAERVLGMPRSGWEHGVTPTVLSRAGVLELAEYVGSLPARPLKLRRQLLLAANWLLGRSGALALGGNPRDRWRAVLLASVPWTEFALYYTFLEATGKFEKYHCHSDRGLSGQNVWQPHAMASWRPVRDAGKPPFLVVQSKAGIPPDQVWRQIEHLFAA